MDVAAAIDRKNRLQSELDTIMNHGLKLPKSRYILASEIARLDTWIPNEYNRSVADTSSLKIPVENRVLMTFLSRDLKLNSLSSLVDFRSQLTDELQEISNFRQPPLLLTHQFIRRVIEIFDNAIIKEQEKQTSSSRSPPGRVDGWMPLQRHPYEYEMYVNYCIDQAIATETANDPNGITVNKVLWRLENNPAIVVDDTVRRIVHQRFAAATNPLDSNRGPMDLPRRRSKL